MAINYAPTGSLINTGFRHGTIDAGTSTIRRIAAVVNGANSALIALRSATTHFFYKFDADGTLPSSVSASFTSGVSLSSALSLRPWLHINGADSYVFIPEGTNNILRVYKFNVATVSGTIGTGSAYTSYTAAGGTRSVAFYKNGNTGYIFLATASTTASILFWKVDLTTVWTLGSPTATFNAGYTCTDLVFHYNGTSSILVTLDSSTGRINTWVVDPDTLSGTKTTTDRAGVYTTGTSPVDLAYYQNGSTGYCFARRSAGGTGAIAYYKVNPATVQTLTTPTATFNTSATSGAIDFIYNGSLSYLLAPDQVNNRNDCFRFNPETVATTDTAPTFSFVCDYTPQAVVGALSGSLGYVLSSENSDTGTDIISLYRTTFNDRSLGVAQTDYYDLLPASAPIRKVSGGTLTLYSETDFFTANQILRFGAGETASGLGTTVFGYSYTATSDTTGTIGENFIFSGATAGITGDYRLTMGSSTTLTLANKGTYNDSFTVPSTGTLVMTANTVLGSDFILSAGTTVNGSGYALTIPYADPGLVLGSGVTLVAPTIAVSAPNYADGTRVQISHRQVFTVAHTAIDTIANTITLGNDSNGDAPAFSVSPRTLVRFNLNDGATLPETSPLIRDGGLYYAELSGSALKLRITASGSAIDFTSQGDGSFELIADTELDNSQVSGGSGYSFELMLSNNARFRRKAGHWSSVAGVAKSSKFYDDVFAWNNVSGFTFIEAIDNTDPESQDAIHERLVSISTLPLAGKIDNALGEEIDTVTLPNDGSTVTGLSFALEGTGLIQVNADDVDGILAVQALYVWGAWVRSTEEGIRLASATTFVANDIFNFVIDKLEIDNTSSTQLSIVGGVLTSADGSNMIAPTSNSVIPNAMSKGTGAIIPGGSVLTPEQEAKLDTIADNTAALYNGLTPEQITTLGAILTQVGTLYNGLTPSQATALAALYNGLTPEQITTLAAIQSAVGVLYNGLTPEQITQAAAIKTKVDTLYNGLTPEQVTQAAAIEALAEAIRDLEIDRNKVIGLIAGVTASQKPPTTDTPGYLTTSDGSIEQVLTLVDGEITISREV